MSSIVKKLSIVLLLVILAVTLTGCGNSEEAVKSVVSKYFQAKRMESKTDLVSTLDITFTASVTFENGTAQFNRDQYAGFMDNIFNNFEYSSINPSFSSVEINSTVASVSVVTTDNFTFGGKSYVGLLPHDLTLTKRGNKWYITTLTENFYEGFTYN